MREIRTALLLVLLLHSTAEAQVRETAPLLLQLPASTRALGLGGAYPLASADNDALFYHPGLLDAARGVGASVALFEAATLVTMSGAAEFWGGGLAFGVQSLGFSAPTRTSGAFARGEAGLAAEGAVNAGELALSAGYGRSIKGFRVGLVGRYVELSLPGERERTVAGDIGIARRLGIVTLGFAAQNIGRAPELEGEDAALPLTLTLGAGTQSAPLGPLDVAAAAAISRWQDGTVVPQAGLEAGYWPRQGRTFIARVGVRYIEHSDITPFTLGAGFVGDRIAIDYAWQGYDDARGVHRIGARLR